MVGSGRKRFGIQKMYFLFPVVLVFHLLSAKCQSQDCTYVDGAPSVFHQNRKYAGLALKIIKERENQNSADTMTLLPNVSRKEILKDLKGMIADPNSIKLNDNGYYCGIVVVLNWLLNNRPDLYAKAVIDLSFSGKTEFNNNEIKLPNALIKRVSYQKVDSVGVNLREDIDRTSISDFILGVSLVYAEKNIQKFGLLWHKAVHEKKNIGNYLFANTMPWEVNDYFRYFGIEVEKSSYYLGMNKNIETLQMIEDAVIQGEMPIIFENHLITSIKCKNFFYRIIGAHFIAVHGFKINAECGTISISYWDYGEVNNIRELSTKSAPLAATSFKKAAKRAAKLEAYITGDKVHEITYDEFFKGMKGFWIPKNNLY